MAPPTPQTSLHLKHHCNFHKEGPWDQSCCPRQESVHTLKGKIAIIMKIKQDVFNDKPRFSATISFAAFKAVIVRVSIHSKSYEYISLNDIKNRLKSFE